jgi:hypothetical protein
MIETIDTTSVTIAPEWSLNQLPTPLAWSLIDVVVGDGLVGGAGLADAKTGTGADTGFRASLIPVDDGSDHLPG